MNKQLTFFTIGLVSTFFGLSYMANGLQLLISPDIFILEPIVSFYAITIPVLIGSPLVTVGGILLWISFKFFKKSDTTNRSRIITVVIFGLVLILIALIMPNEPFTIMNTHDTNLLLDTVYENAKKY